MPTKAKGICECNHTGDGSGSDHEGTELEPGLGACSIPGCKCKVFRWSRFTIGYAMSMGSGVRPPHPHPAEKVGG